MSPKRTLRARSPPNKLLDYYSSEPSNFIMNSGVFESKASLRDIKSKEIMVNKSRQSCGSCKTKYTKTWNSPKPKPKDYKKDK